MSNKFETPGAIGPDEETDKAIEKVVTHGWKNGAAESENGEALLLEATTSVYHEIDDSKAFDDEEKKALILGLNAVKFDILPTLEPSTKTVQYINQVGGASNLIKHLMLEETARLKNSPPFMKALVNKGMLFFFHVSGLEVYTNPRMWEQHKQDKGWK